jgi:hypothetical protein
MPTFRELAVELEAVLAREREAIAALDADGVNAVVADKQRLADALATAPDAHAHKDAARALQIAVRANAMLAAAAGEAVRALLGRETTGYDRRARYVGCTSRRSLATY